MKTESEKVRSYLFAVFGLFLMASMSFAVSFARFTHAGTGMDGGVIVAGLAGLVTFVPLFPLPSFSPRSCEPTQG